MRQAGVVHDRVHPDRVYPMAAEQLASGGEYPFARSCLSLPGHPMLRILNCMTIVMYLLD
jgi:hypothetical protein